MRPVPATSLMRPMPAAACRFVGKVSDTARSSPDGPRSRVRNPPSGASIISKYPDMLRLRFCCLERTGGVCCPLSAIIGPASGSNNEGWQAVSRQVEELLGGSFVTSDPRTGLDVRFDAAPVTGTERDRLWSLLDHGASG
jgi:hypothetical protein